MGSLNLEDFALDDTTGLAVQIGNFEALLSDYYTVLLNYVPATVDIGQQHPDDWLWFLGTLESSSKKIYAGVMDSFIFAYSQAILVVQGGQQFLRCKMGRVGQQRRYCS